MENTIENLQEQIKKLESENRLKTGWISLLSHDQKELFNNLSMLINAVETQTISHDDFFAMLPRLKHDAQKNLNSLLATNQWLQTQFEGFAPKKEKLTAENIFITLELNFAEKLTAKNVQLQLRGNGQVEFYADSLLLRFILAKILDNAIKYSHTNGTVYFEVQAHAEYTLVTIQDEGLGMSEGQKKSIFTFDSAVFQGTEGEIGAGLSLKIVKNFVHLMQGKIEIDSAEDKGTTISILLPQI